MTLVINQLPVPLTAGLGHQRTAWTVSLCVHTLAMACAVSLLHEAPALAPPVYRLELLLKSPPDGAPRRETPATSSEPTPATSPRPQARRPTQVRPVEAHPVVARAVIHQTLSPIQRAAAVERPPAETTPIQTPSPTVAPQPVERRVVQTEAAAEALATPSPESQSAPVMERTVLTRAAPQTPAVHRQVAAPQPMYHARQHDEAASALSTSEPGSGAPSLEDRSHSATTSTSSSVAASSAQDTQADGAASSSASASDSGDPAAPPTAEAMHHPPLTTTVPSKTELGWLKELLKKRIQSLQAYPRLARMQGWEGNVVVRATIRDDGHLLDATVIQGSGYAVLDHDAVQLVRRACPIHFPHALGQSHIDVVIPVHYRLE